MYRIFWFILATLGAQLEGPQPDRSAYLDKMECGDCKQVNRECQIVSSGYFCRESEDTDLIDERKAAANLKHLSSCMAPGHFFLKREEISSACCFWAPQIGCQQVKNKLRTKPCSDCATYHERVDRSSI
ncbi:uncharacterized protein LOC117895956 isoform X1 [Drosophila subobscura]|uniref:uncharacterized protein LOC117895956 isoform X1 n=1 Tax=Drosophila subobscura TaxID=7241 RepID=UPI00155A36BA|nr:uncharacterized protein LOC117895956 isoform X1 [Drosophila subobscura]